MSVEPVQLEETELPPDAPRTKDGRPIQLGQHGQYLLTKRLERYAAGQVEVMQARQRLVERDVQVHVLRTSRRNDPERVDAFMAAAERLAVIEHPGVLPVMDIDESGSRAFFTTQVRPGVSLAEYRRKRGGRLEGKEVAHLFSSLADALEALHRGGLLHPEISAETVYFEPERYRLYFATLPLGPPEDVVDPKSEGPVSIIGGQLWDERTDIFLLGFLALECLAGEVPVLEVPHPQSRLRIPPVHGVLDGYVIPEGLQSALIVALEASVTRRYATARDLSRDLDLTVKAPAVPVVDPDKMTYQSSIRQAIRVKHDVARKRRRLQSVASFPAPIRPFAKLAVAPPRWLAPVAALALLAAVPWLAPEHRRSAAPAVENVTYADPAAAMPVEEQRQRAERVTAAARRAAFRATTTRSFDERWNALSQWLSTPAGQLQSKVLHRDLVKLRLAFLRGHAGAGGRLDELLQQVREMQEGEGAAQAPDGRPDQGRDDG